MDGVKEAFDGQCERDLGQQWEGPSTYVEWKAQVHMWIPWSPTPGSN